MYHNVLLSTLHRSKPRQCDRKHTACGYGPLKQYPICCLQNRLFKYGHLKPETFNVCASATRMRVRSSERR